MLRKFILTAALSLAVGSAAGFAQAADADDEPSTFTFGYCTGGTSALKPPEVGKRYCSAICIDEQTATKYQGMKIVGVKIATGHACTKMPMTIFVTGNDQTFDYEQSAKMGSEPYVEETYTLDQAYPIEAGKQIIVGFSAKGSAAYLGPIVFDKTPTSNPNAFLVAKQTDNGGWDWATYAEQYGANCIRVVIEGTGLPKNDAAISLGEIGFVTLGQKVEIPVNVTNTATNQIKNLTFSVEVADEAPVEVSATANIPERDDKGTVILKVPCATEGLNVPVRVTLVKVNGVEIAQSSSSTAAGNFICLASNKAYKRNVVMEEGTGTWCSWCPRGMVTIEKLLKDFPDGSFIPIAVHNGDAMAVNSYSELSFGSYPGCAINRNPAYGSNVDYKTCHTILERIYAKPAIVKVVLNASQPDKAEARFQFDATVTFGGSATDMDYRLAFVITENGVGPYQQKNSYAGSSEEMGGWESKPSMVSTIFNEVARDIFVFSGIKGSLPSDIEAGTPYKYSGTYSTSHVKAANVDNCRFIALVINGKTGIIENAVSTTLSESAAITEVSTEEQGISLYGRILCWNGNGTASVYTLDGRLAASIESGAETDLAPGLYIVATPAGSVKIAVR